MSKKPLSKAAKAEAIRQVTISFADKKMNGFFFSYNTPNGRFSMMNGDLRGMREDLKNRK